jgi:hypothetical protein
VPRGNKKLKRLPYERCNSYLELMCQPLKLTFNYILQINGNRSVVPGPCLLARSGWLRKKYSPLRPHQSISVPAALGHRLPLHRRKGKGQLQRGGDHPAPPQHFRRVQAQGIHERHVRQ